MTLMLLVSSAVALVLLIVHSWRTRGRFVTLAFFISGILFGILRGNWVWLNIRVVAQTAEVTKPYLPQGGILPEIGHASLQVAVGWVFALYLAWTVSELILRRIPRLAGRVFVVSAVASLFMLAIAYAMETTAVTVGWWYWTLPTRTALFGNVNVPGMWAWFSVAPDFLMPFLVIVCSSLRKRRVRWLWLLVFPLHKFAHMGYGLFEYMYLVHEAMLVLVLVPAFFSVLRMDRGQMGAASPDGRRFTALLPAGALVIFFGVLAAGNIVCGGGVANLMTLVPLLMLCLLAWGRLPVWTVAALSLVGLAGYAVVGPRVLHVLVPAAAFGFLALFVRLREPPWLKLLPTVLTVLLTAAVVWAERVDAGRGERYVEAWQEGDRLAFAGSSEEAEKAYERSDRLRPKGLLAYYVAVTRMTRLGELPPQQAALLLECRMERLAGEFAEIVRRDPEWTTPREHLALFDILMGKLPEAAEQYREMHRLRGGDGDITAMLGYLLLRQDKPAEAEEVCTRAAGLRKAPVAAVINLGVIRFAQGRSDEAHVLWQRALATSPGHPVALVNLARPGGEPAPNVSDMRYLARAPKPHAAVWANNLAAYARSLSAFDKLRLLLEATQFDPRFVRAHLNLVKSFYLPEKGPYHSQVRALWHARRAVALAREAHDDAELVEGLLLLGEALSAAGEPQEARGVLEEGRTKAPAGMRADFDRLLGSLRTSP